MRRGKTPSYCRAQQYWTKSDYDMHLGMATGCLNEVAEVLERFECQHGMDHGRTPPMFYREWLLCILAKHGVLKAMKPKRKEKA